MTKWTKEQEAFIEKCEDGEAINLRAVAGSGKTSVLVEGVKRMSQQHHFAGITCVAFNKDIAVELSERMPPTVDCRTMNSVGHRAWSGMIERRLELDTRKTQTISKDLWGEDFSFYEDEDLQDIPKLVGLAKQSALTPGSDAAAWHDLIFYFDLSIPDHRADEAVKMAREILCASIDAAWGGLIDFNDQLYMPVVFGGRWEKRDFILIDEAQDISGIQRIMLRRMLADKGSLIAVGDPQQAIYGFRGAEADSMSLIMEEFGQVRMGLTYTFRCSKAVTEEARKIVPDIKCPRSAPDGSVIHASEWKLKDLTPNDAIICRNTKPLVDVAMRMIRRRISCYVLGRDIGSNLIKFIEMLRPITPNQLIDRLSVYKVREVNKCIRLGLEAKAEAISDKCDTINALIETIDAGLMSAGQGLRVLKSTIKSLFSEPRSGVVLSTIHKFKGLERQKIYFLDSHLIPSRYATQEWQLQQENNLYYVAVTRAKEDLVFVNSERAE